MIRLFLAALLLFVTQQTIAQQVLIEEKQGSFVRAETRFLSKPGASYTDIGELRLARRVGAGVQTFGAAGLIGLLVELNLSGSDATTVGFGAGPNYTTLSGGWKRILTSQQSLQPYTNLGATLWQGSGQSGLNTSNPSFLSGRLLSQNERVTGQFQKALLSPAIGVQWIELGGPNVGGSVFAEVVFLTEPSRFEVIPTASLGAIYYF